jgi:transposase-like protein
MSDSRLAPLVLSDAERRTLQGWATRRRTAQGLALRARIVLACAEDRSNTAVAVRLGISRTTVRKWRDRFLARRLDGLGDERRPGVPRSISDAQVEEVVRTLEEVPEGAAHWAKRELARRVGSGAVLPGRQGGLTGTAAMAPSRAACRDGWKSPCRRSIRRTSRQTILSSTRPANHHRTLAVGEGTGQLRNRLSERPATPPAGGAA